MACSADDGPEHSQPYDNGSIERSNICRTRSVRRLLRPTTLTAAGCARACRLLLRVLASGLRCGTLEVCLLALVTRLARPGALQVVSHPDMEPAQVLHLQVDEVTVHEGIEAPVVRAQR